MPESGHEHKIEWVPSVYYAQILVDCPLARAWEILLDYRAWNPDFVGARVIPVSGKHRTQGEVVLISKPVVMDGEPLPEFFAETAKLTPHRRVVWYVYPKSEESFRNFVDFALDELPSGVRFNIDYYEQIRLAREAIKKHREEFEKSLHDCALAFKRYCEANV
jgi:hypothetical protein